DVPEQRFLGRDEALDALGHRVEVTGEDPDFVRPLRRCAAHARLECACSECSARLLQPYDRPRDIARHCERHESGGDGRYHEERDLRTRPVENTEELALRSDLIVEPFAFGAEQPIRIAGKPIPEPAAIEVPVVIGPDADSALPPSFFFLSALEPAESFLGLQSVLAKLLFHGTT